MKLSRGDVILVEMPFSDGSGAKIRPTVVVQSDLYNAKLTAAVVAMLTSNIRATSVEPATLLVDVSTDEGKQSGLHSNPSVNCTTLFTISESRIKKRIGKLPQPMMVKVDECLKAALGLT